MAIRHVAVLGAGVMGCGIAAHLSNAGVEVTLLDRPLGESPDGGGLAAQALQGALSADPAPFMHRRNARLIRTGNLRDDLGLLAEADWIIEAVVERLDVKRDLYARVDRVRRPGSIVSSNTSTIPLAQLNLGASESFRRDFMVTHFFNPPRYMRLLELVPGPETRADAVQAIRDFCDHALGKTVVACNDTPGFIA
ncbi:MAG: 3-hydroxyacyl-CoA dehydrogenase family protein, partial [Gammaproteobacteria bacterium]|nr:3-hydroxyacyl-CoA dehydrogenase family protein [Gammaproteobacteria bacterium]